MRSTILCLVILCALASLALAQTDPLHATVAEIGHVTGRLASASATELATQTDWRIRLPELNLTEKAAGVRPSPAALKSEPATLATLTQGSKPPRVGFEVSVGGFRPGGQLRNTELIKTAVGGGFTVAVRPFNTSRVQLDAGLDFLFDGIGSPRREEVLPGEFRDVTDVEVFLNFGPRVYLTPRDSALKFSVGGGPAYASYIEFIPSDTDNDDNDFNNPPGFTCLTCEERSGWGFYGMAQLRYQINSTFGLGVTAKYYRVTTQGGVFSTNLPQRTTDDWLGFMFTFSFR